ncbi:MAG: nitrite reductase small subunit [Pseudomonadota bacterium]|nr:nitrite reductase small subunit [Pseudomonadota bacterium]
MSNWIEVGTVQDIPKLGARVVQAPQGDIAIFRNAQDEIFALADKCPHKGGPLSQGLVHGKTVTCPMHNWKISMENGEAVAPDHGCSRVYAVKLDGEKIFLDLAK